MKQAQHLHRRPNMVEVGKEFLIVSNAPRLANSAGFYAQNYQTDAKLKIFILLSSYT